ncbi:MAG: hypothetical protein HYY20_02995 [Candidatus Tectomicrobia bacterium]|uniref:Uncharacterized protein n=1 Tax=Tectimicrobiota bacterium TaxID=2528274 RepID=A0A932FZX9_UNCTE|nr:hypothetical protein [Candidatus Tectomicrobia bacterium]
MRTILLVLLCLLLTGSPSFGAEPDANGGPGVLHRVVTYLPNRVLDVLDLVRLRVRVGPGAAVGIRATEAADFFLGSYIAIYAGLPGPRNRRLPKLPVGIENSHGIEVSVADLSTGMGLGPGYSNTEFGFGFQAALIGLDLGVDPVELLDLVGGFLLLDLRGDDL